ncbi:MAG TPA: pyridoxamine 5'-phosphate oxidase family protein [Candidatus Binataceae bacterium]|nr:pyridoxamine 5'-phosphate oxidase family protein [Candidatus Binataceae bacterium]
MERRNIVKMSMPEIVNWLQNNQNLSLASLDRDGYPHLVAMTFAMDNGDIVMTSYGKAQKVLNLKRNPRAGVMVESGRAYNQLKGVMVRGRAEIIEGAEAVLNVMRLIGEKAARISGSPQAAQVMPSATARRQAEKRVVIRIHPEKYASWDHSKLPAGTY